MAKKESLTKQLADQKELTAYWKGKFEAILEQFEELEAKEKKRISNEMGSYNVALSSANDLNQQLMEIVRWHINPKTAEKLDFRTCPNCRRVSEQREKRCSQCGFHFN